MRSTIRFAVLGLTLATTTPALAAGAPRPAGWFNVGLNGTHVDASEENCGGGQAGFSLGHMLLLRGQYTHVSYEADDDTDTCDGAIWGDSDAGEWAAMAGLTLGRSGLYVAGGPARVDFEATPYASYGRDTGSRVEVGWSAKLAQNWPVGFEVVAFRTDTEIRDYHGIGINASFGPKGRAQRARNGNGNGRGGRY